MEATGKFSFVEGKLLSFPKLSISSTYWVPPIQSGLTASAKQQKAPIKPLIKKKILESKFDQVFSKWSDYIQALEILPLCCTDALSLTHNFI